MDSKQKNIITIFITVFILLLIFLVIAYFSSKSPRRGSFNPISMDLSEIEGEPTGIDNDCSYNVAKISNSVSIGLCGTPILKENKILLYATSVETNDFWLRVRLLDESETNILGETNIIEPGYYVDKIDLNNKVKEDDMIVVKFMRYEKNTYYSLGEVKFKVKIKEN